MRKCLAIAFLFLAVRCFGAVGDITGADIEANGWVARLFISGLNTNGNIFPGFGVSNATETFTTAVNPTLTFRVRDNGYNADGSTTTVARAVFGTHVIRFAWSNAAANLPPGPNTNHIATDGSGCIVRVALSDYICSPSGVTLDALAGAYAVTNATTNCNAISGLSVTNGSSQPYPKALGFPQTVPWQVVGGSNYSVDVVAASYFASDGDSGIAAVHMWGVDADGHRSPTNIITAAIADKTKPTPTIVWRGFIWQTNFTAGLASTNFTNYVKIFPKIGNAASVWDSSDGTYDADSVFLGPQVFFSNRNNDHSICFACIDRTNGVAAGNIYTNLSSLTAAPVCFTNINYALNALAITNLTLFGKSNWDNCVLLLTNGRHGWISDDGNSPPTPTTRLGNRSWLTISNYPGVARADAVICTNRGSQNIQKLSKVKFSGITVDWIGSSGIFNVGHWALWLNSCYIKTNSQTGGSLSQFNTNAWLTDCDVERHRYGFKTQGTPITDRWHIWGNRFICNPESMQVASFIGNKVLPTHNGATAIKGDYTGGAFAPWCYSFNQIYRADTLAIPLEQGLSHSNVPIGTLIVQNVFEVYTNGGGNPPWDMMNSARQFEVITNCINWNNTALCVYHEPYNHETNQNNLFAPFYSHVGNIFGDFEGWFDAATSGTGAQPDPARTNRWNLMYGVGNRLNAGVEQNGTVLNIEGTDAASGNFGFGGLAYAYYATNNASNMFRFMDYGAMVGTTKGTGGGNYQLRSDSILFRIPSGRSAWVLPYDILGNTRSAVDPPGAFSAGNPRHGIGF